MTDDSQAKVTDVLKNLIETCRDGQKGYAEAAAHISANHSLKQFFREQSTERGRFLSELTQEMQTYAKDVDTSGSISGTLHRTWLEIKGNVTGGDDHAILETVEQGEDYAKKAYEDAVNASLPSHILEVVRRQQGSVNAAHDKVRSMRDATEKV